ncbi:MAG: DUF4910 domain-containing protein [Lentisphaeria bacterium]|nr:DUF4910 domain-containing protein [Lentisphaeria bacterium]
MKNTFLLEKFRRYCGTLDIDSMLVNTQALLECELPQTFSAYHAAADKALELIKNAGIPNGEKITFAADGKTAFQDKITPIGWEATYGTLEIKSASALPTGTILADYTRHPFELIKGSTGTAQEGEDVEIISYSAMLAGADVTGALVMSPANAGPVYNYLSTALDLGARGFVSDYAMNSNTRPDGIQWCNAYTEHNNWHVNSGDRPFIAFAISPANGKKLRQSLDSGSVICHISSDARRVESTVDVVTALVPGKSKKEFWILAHLYEPLSNDNSSGVAAAIETARAIMAQGTPDYSLRIVFGLELYGFCAYAHHRGNRCLADEVIGGCNYDAMYLHPGWKIKLCNAGAGTPTFANLILQELFDTLQGEQDVPELLFYDSFDAMYQDDSSLSDSTTGVATVWPLRLQDGTALWHNSEQDMSYIGKKEFTIGCAINTTIVDSCVNPRMEVAQNFPANAGAALKKELARAVGSQKEHLLRRKDILCANAGTLDERFDEIKQRVNAVLEEEFAKLEPQLNDEIPHSPWRDYAELITVSRVTTGFPYDLAALPPRERRGLPGAVIYGPLGVMLANMDGKRDLATVIRRAEHEISRLLPENEIKKLLSAIFFLADNGYLSLNGFKGVTKADIVSALRSAGVERGDFLLVHSSLSAFGYISGGGNTIIEAFKEAVGEEGTFLLPSFNYAFANIGGPCRSPIFRPYDPNDLDAIWTGTLPKILLKNFPDAVRSAHITHSWCGCGKDALAATAAARPCDPPAGKSSPLDYALKAGGKIIHFGNKIGSTTFLHYVETCLDLPGLADTLCMVRGADGELYPAAVPKNLPGCRDFYSSSKGVAKIFKKAQEEKGFQITKVQLAQGEICVMDIKQLYDIAVEFATKDPFILLHDEGQCRSCDHLRKVYIQQHKQR